MRKKILLFLLLINSLSVYSQVDTIIHNGLYKSLYSYEYSSCMYVEYKLYKGGGDCNRSQFSFHTGGVKYSATNKDFVASGFDKGHLVPAEDFAYDCKLEEKTFYFYNVVAQYPNLNRGLWKTYEEKIRDLSQKDSLIIYCGGIYEHGDIINPVTKVGVPKYCWKVVKSLSTGEILYCLFFSNEPEKNYVKRLTIEQMLKYIGNYKELKILNK